MSNATARKAKAQAADPRGSSATTLVVATVVVVLVIGAIVTAVILGVRGKDAASTAGGAALPTGAPAMGAGIVVNPNAPANVPILDLYEDFQCPQCARFEQIFGLQIAEMIRRNEVKLVAHPLSFLDDNLGNDSSNRAANAAACAADAGRFLPYHSAVFDGQPAQEGAGYTDAQLRQFGQAAGLTGASLATFDQCFAARSHNQWVESVQTQSEKDHVTGTPTILLNGKAVTLAGLDRASLAQQVKGATK